jgi:nucleoside-diphosphate-sugar epimerase
MKILVTGASGFLGSHIVEQVIAQKDEARALVRHSSNKAHLEGQRGVEIALGDVGAADSLEKAMEGVDAVIHSAGLVKARSQKEFDEVNTAGTAMVLASAKRAGVKRFVYVSSLTVVGSSVDGKPVAKDAPAAPLTGYARSKWAAEELVRSEAKNLPVTIIRPPLIYGPRDREVLSFFKAIKSGLLPYLGDGQNTLSVTYAPDCAAACVRAAKSFDVPSGNTYFVDDGESYVWRQMLTDMEDAMGKKALVSLPVPFFLLTSIAAVNTAFAKLTNSAVMLTLDKVNELKQRHWVCDSHDTRRDLKWEPQVKWKQGVHHAAQWYRDNGML